MITGSYDTKIKVWIAQSTSSSWILSQTYQIHSDAVWYLQTLPEIKLIASCGLDGKVAVMNYSDYENLEILYILQGKLDFSLTSDPWPDCYEFKNPSVY